MDNISTEPTFIPSFLETATSGILNAIQVMSYWEVIAVVLGVAYIVLAMRENSWCWYAAFGSTAIFSWLFFDVSLVMESALNVYYLAMAVYGWYVWNKPKGLHASASASSATSQNDTGISNFKPIKWLFVKQSHYGGYALSRFFYHMGRRINDLHGGEKNLRELDLLDRDRHTGHLFVCGP